MKKKLIAFIAVIAVIASLCTCLVACNNKNNDTAKASNSETLGTAVAVATGYLGGAASAAEDSESSTGLNINFGGNLVVAAAFAPVKSILENYIAMAVESTQAFISESNVTIVKAESDDVDFSTMYTVTVSYTDKETDEEVTQSYNLYINAEKADGSEADIDGTEAYTFTAVMKIGSIAALSISGEAKFDTTKDAMVFDFSLGVNQTSVSVKAWAGENGSIVTNVNVGIVGTASVDVVVELGRLSDNSYGAKVDVVVEVAGAVSVTVDVDIVAQGTEADGDFNVSGNVNVTAASVTVVANISGTASYVDTGNSVYELELSLSGTASVSAN